MKGRRLKVLFVCSKNRWRSPTAEHIYRNDTRLEVRSAGVKSEAKRKISEADLSWADVFFVMEREHKQLIIERFSYLDLPEIEVLSIPDDFKYLQPELQLAVREAVDPELEVRLNR